MAKKFHPQEKRKLRTWVEIDRKNIEHNCRIFRNIIGSRCFLMAVVKSNAYGHSLVDFSLAARDLGVDWFGVDSIVEAESLRDAGLKKPILVLGYTLQNKREDAAKKDISLTVADFASLKNFQGKKPKIHLKIDTGMHRQGFLSKELPEAIGIIKRKGIFLEGVYTHFAAAKNPSFPADTLQQIKEFKEALDLLSSAGFEKLIRHASATSGAIIFPQAHFDMVRVGIGLYGLWPSKETQAAYKNHFSPRPVLSWKTIVSQIKILPKGSRIGYDLAETLPRHSRVAVLPIGYWHGFPRLLSSVGEVIINGQKAKVLGRVSMDMISVDITDIKDTKIGDEAVLIGKQKETEVTADDLAYLTDTTCYEIISRLNPLMKRVIT